MDLCSFTKELWTAYLSENHKEIFSLLDHFSPDCSIIGTGKHENYQNLAQFKDALELDIQDRQGICFQFRDFWCREQRLSETICLVYGGLYIWWNSDDDLVHINMDSRFTMIYQKEGSDWKIIHLHQSLPNLEQMDGEYYPRTLTAQIEQSHQTIEQLTTLAQRDGLTGLINFHTFQTLYPSLDKQDSWLFVVDLDNFKYVNDTYGHLAGNHVLKRMAEIMTGTVRAHDLVCRMGGDEFVLYCANLGNEKNANALLHRLMKQAADASQKETVWAGISIGGTAIRDTEPLEETFKRADAALYKAKESGKNGWHLL